MWILGNAKRDIGWILAPGLLAWIIARQIPSNTPAFPIALLICAGFVDSGHVFSTLLRTYFNPAELRSSPRYWIIPVLVFLGIFSWYFLRLPYLLSALVYFTVYHNVRQYYGVCAWYQKLAGRRCRFSNFYSRALPLAAFVAYHFRRDAWPGFQRGDEIFLLRAYFEYYEWVLVLYGLFIGSWLVFEFDLRFRQKIWEPARFLSLLSPAVTFGLVFLLGRNLLDVLAPMYCNHGIPYLALVALSLPRTMPSFYVTLKKAAAFTLVTAFVFGMSEAAFSETVDFSLSYETLPSNVYLAILVAAALTPQLTHFILDAYIWKRDHREAKQVFQAA